jgi:hypothetical protein
VLLDIMNIEEYEKEGEFFVIHGNNKENEIL